MLQDNDLQHFSKSITEWDNISSGPVRTQMSAQQQAGVEWSHILHLTS